MNIRIDHYHHFVGADHLTSSLDRITTSLQELTMALNAEGQAMRDAIDAATTKVGKAIDDAVKAITDLVTAKAGNIQMSDIQPQIDTLSAAADVLEKTATDADPAVNPTAPPLPTP